MRSDEVSPSSHWLTAKLLEIPKAPRSVRQLPVTVSWHFTFVRNIESGETQLRLIHTYHAVPLPCSDHAALQATSQGQGTARQGHAMVCVI